MNDSDAVHIPLAFAVIVVSIVAILLVSLAVTVVLFDNDGRLRRPARREPWGTK